MKRMMVQNHRRKFLDRIRLARVLAGHFKNGAARRRDFNPLKAHIQTVQLFGHHPSHVEIGKP